MGTSVMLPNNTLASVHQFSEWKYAYPLTNSATVSYEWGGVALTDTTQGHDAFLWKLEYISGGLYLGKVGDTATLQLTIGQGISRTALAFDSNMRPTYAWQSGLETCVLYYYDTSLNDFTQVTFEGIYSPCLTLDDNRPQSSSISDIIFAYLKGDQLCYRQQRDRFLTEYVLATVEQKHLVRVGMNKKHRLQFMLKTALPVQ